MHTYTLANSIFDGPITTLLSILCILVEVLSRAHAKKGKCRNDFKFGTFIGRFSSDDATSTAMKGLIYTLMKNPSHLHADTLKKIFFKSADKFTSRRLLGRSRRRQFPVAKWILGDGNIVSK